MRYPIYLIQVLDPPEAIIDKLKSLFSGFLLSENGSHKTINWVQGNKLWLPIAVIWNYERLKSTICNQIERNCRSQSRLRSNFLRDNYCNGNHSMLVSVWG